MELAAVGGRQAGPQLGEFKNKAVSPTTSVKDRVAFKVASITLNIIITTKLNLAN